MATLTKTQNGLNATGSGTSIAFSTVSLPAAGELVIAGVSDGTAVVTIADNKGNTFTVSAVEQTAGGMRTQIGWCVLPSTPTGTYTVTATLSATDYGTLFVSVWSGLADDALDVTAILQNGTPSGATLTGPAITTLGADDIVFALVMDNEGATENFTSGGSFTTIDQQTDGATFGAACISSRPGTGGTSLGPGTYTPSWTVTGGPLAFGVSNAAFKEGTPPPPQPAGRLVRYSSSYRRR